MKRVFTRLFLIIFALSLMFPPGAGDYVLRVIPRVNAQQCVNAHGSAITKLVIDPGHGGKDPGASHIVVEKEVALEISLQLEYYLKSNYEVDILMTRDSDVYLTLAERCRIANAWGADFFFSVHSNAGGGYGYEDYIRNSPCAETVRIRDEIHPYIAKVWEDAGRRNRGKKNANFHVLANTEMPAMLVELGFVDNEEDAALLQDDVFIEKLVREMGEGIAAALRLPPLQGMEGPEITADGRWTSAASVPVTICSGNGSGVDFTEYRLLGAGDERWRKYTGSFSVKEEGITIIEARNVYAGVGIVSETNTAVVRIDRSGPGEPSLHLSDDEWTAEDVTFSLDHGVDTGKEVNYSWYEVYPYDYNEGEMDNIRFDGAGTMMLDRWEESFEYENSLVHGGLPVERTKGAARTGSFGLKTTPAKEPADDDEKPEGQHGQLVPYEQLCRGDDFYLSGWVRTDGGYVNTGLTGLCFGVPWEVESRGYQAVIDMRNGSDDTAAFQLRRNYWHRLDFDDEITVEQDTWYRIEVLWDKQGEITARLYDEDGALLSELKATDNTYTSGFFGVAAYSNSSFDDLQAGRYLGSSGDAVVIGNTMDHAEGSFHHILFRAPEDFSGDLKLTSFNRNEGFKNDGRVEFASVANADGDNYGVIKDASFKAGDKEVTLKDIQLKEGRYYVLGHTDGYYRYPTKRRPAGRYMEILKSGHVWGEIGKDPYERTYGFAEYIFTPNKARGVRISPPANLSFLGTAAGSHISWDAAVPDGSAVRVETSHNGSSWHEAVNGGAVSGINPGDDLEGRRLYVRQILETTREYSGPQLRNLKIDITGNPGGSGAVKSQYRIGDDGEWKDYSGSVTVDKEGATSVYARTIDRAGNTGSEAVTAVRIDRTPPEIKPAMKKSDGSPYNSGSLSTLNVIVSAEFTDVKSGVDGESAVFSLDNGETWQDYKGPFTVKGQGTHEILLAVSDKAGNTGEAQVRVKISEPGIGDVTGDGTISVIDAIKVLRYIVGLTSLDENAISRARVNGSESGPDISDAILILRYVVGLIKEFPG